MADSSGTLMAQVMSCMETVVSNSASQVENDIGQISGQGSIASGVTGGSGSSTNDAALTQLQVDVSNWNIATQAESNTLKSLVDAMSATTQNVKT